MLKRCFLIFLVRHSPALSAGCAAAATTARRRWKPPAPRRQIWRPQEPAEMPRGFRRRVRAPGQYRQCPCGSSDQRIVIRNASLTIVVDDPGASMTAISRMAESMGGFVVTSDLHKTYHPQRR